MLKGINQTNSNKETETDYFSRNVPGGQFVKFHFEGEGLLGHWLVGGVIVGRQVPVGQRLFNGDPFTWIKGQESAQQVESGCVSLEVNKVVVKKVVHLRRHAFRGKG